MKFIELLEVELGKDPEHEKIISQRKKALEKKIVGKEKSKLKTLRKIEKISDEFMTAKDAGKFARERGDKVMDEIEAFSHFALKKLEDYAEDEQQIEIPIGAIPTAQGILMNILAMNLGKAERKLFNEIIKLEKPKNTEELIKMFTMSADEMYKKLGNKVPGLDVDELEEFVEKVSKDEALKKKIASINKNLNRLYGIYAKTKHLSTAESGKKIEL
jgi:hypothetical protein